MPTITYTPQTLAKVAGITYLIQMAASILGYIPPQRFTSGTITQVATNIMANEGFFRIGIASNLLTYLTVVVLTWALYLLLKPIN